MRDSGAGGGVVASEAKIVQLRRSGMGEDVAPTERLIFADAILQICRADGAGKMLRDGGAYFGSTSGTAGNTFTACLLIHRTRGGQCFSDQYEKIFFARYVPDFFRLRAGAGKSA